MENRKLAAHQLLHEFGLLDKLREIGPAHVTGSYRMDLMAWNDLDVNVENDSMNLDKLYDLTAFTMRTFRPVWFEAKEEIHPAGKKVWFHGFETTVTGELWNVDLWFFDRETIREAERFCDGIAAKTSPAQKDAIVRIKTELIARGMYSFEQFKSMDVYHAVLEKGAKNIEDFLAIFQQKQ